MESLIIEHALSLAVQAHLGQWRDGAAPLPYIAHPVDVMNRLRYVGNVQDEAILAAGVLHDTLEETALSPAEVEQMCGLQVRRLVEWVTRREPTAEETLELSKDEIWALRSSILLDEIRTMPPEAHLIKLADRASNMQAALWVRKRSKLPRYVSQTTAILRIIPEELNPALWRSVSQLNRAAAKLARNS